MNSYQYINMQLSVWKQYIQYIILKYSILFKW